MGYFQTSSQQTTIQLDQQLKHQTSYIMNTCFPEYLWVRFVYKSTSIIQVLSFGFQKQPFELILPVKETSKVTVQPLIPWDKFIWECQSWHETSFLQPEDCTKAAKSNKLQVRSNQTAGRDRSTASIKWVPTHNKQKPRNWSQICLIHLLHGFWDQSLTFLRKRCPPHKQRPISSLQKTLNCKTRKSLA